MEERQLLRDPNLRPTDDIIADALGAASGAYTKFAEMLRERSIHAEWRYYNDGKAWLGKALHKWTTSRGTPKEMTAFWLSVWDGFFKISLFIPKKSAADALALPLSDRVKDRIGASKETGKLSFFTVVFDLRSDELLGEICTLIDFSIRAKK